MRVCMCVYHTLRKFGEKESINKPTYCFTDSVSVCLCICTYVCARVCVYVCARTPTRVHVCVRVCIHTLLWLSILAFVFSCVFY